LLANYGYIGLLLIVAILLAVGTILLPYSLTFIPKLARLIRITPIHIVPKKPNPIKASTYECGMETIGRSWIQFNFRYYFYALIFVALDVLVVFLYPWAVTLRQLGSFGLIAMLIFISIIVVGYIYAWRKKVLEWK